MCYDELSKNNEGFIIFEWMSIPVVYSWKWELMEKLLYKSGTVEELIISFLEKLWEQKCSFWLVLNSSQCCVYFNITDLKKPKDILCPLDSLTLY